MITINNDLTVCTYLPTHMSAVIIELAKLHHIESEKEINLKVPIYPVEHYLHKVELANIEDEKIWARDIREVLNKLTNNLNGIQLEDFRTICTAASLESNDDSFRQYMWDLNQATLKEIDRHNKQQFQKDRLGSSLEQLQKLKGTIGTISIESNWIRIQMKDGRNYKVGIEGTIWINEP